MTLQEVTERPKRASRVFPESEFEARLARVRQAMGERCLDAVLVSSPENIFYLTGLDYQGYFAYQALIVPLEGTPVLITRAMERAIIRDRVPNVRHVGYSDGVATLPPAGAADTDLLMAERRESGEVAGLRPWSTSIGIPTRESASHPSPFAPAGHATSTALKDCGLARSRLGVEKASSLLPLGIVEEIVDGLPEAQFEDASDLVTDCRLVQSPLELENTRKAAAVSESMMLAAIAAAGPGVAKRDVLAAIY
ncbi:MAG: aminopeptidase P family N-terminal domain-containing protein, partial [Alphaproteobacteria bacterium]